MQSTTFALSVREDAILSRPLRNAKAYYLAYEYAPFNFIKVMAFLTVLFCALRIEQETTDHRGSFLASFMFRGETFIADVVFVLPNTGL